MSVIISIGFNLYHCNIIYFVYTYTNMFTHGKYIYIFIYLYVNVINTSTNV